MLRFSIFGGPDSKKRACGPSDGHAAAAFGGAHGKILEFFSLRDARRPWTFIRWEFSKVVLGKASIIRIARERILSEKLGS